LVGLSFCTSPSISPVHCGSKTLGSTRRNETPGFQRVTGPALSIRTVISNRAMGAPAGKVSSPPTGIELPAAMSAICAVVVPIRWLSDITMLQSTSTFSASCVFERFARIAPQLTLLPPYGKLRTEKPF
jgi:hypothetical protein